MKRDSLTDLSQRLAFLSYVQQHPNSSIAVAASYFSVPQSTIHQWVSALWTVGYRSPNEVEAPPQNMIDFDGAAYDAGYLLLRTHQDVAIPLTLSPDDADLVLSTLRALIPAGTVPPGIRQSLPLKLAMISDSEGSVKVPDFTQLEQYKLDQISGNQSLILSAIEQNRRLRLRYIDSDGKVTSRVVSPVELNVSTAVPILLCWCHEREAVRRLRLDRMSDLAVVEQPRQHVHRTKQVGFGIESGVHAQVTCKFPAPMALESLGWPKVKPLDEDHFVVDILVADFAWFTAWVKVHADSVVRIAPNTVRVEVLERLRGEK